MKVLRLDLFPKNYFLDAVRILDSLILGLSTKAQMMVAAITQAMMEASHQAASVIAVRFVKIYPTRKLAPVMGLCTR